MKQLTDFVEMEMFVLEIHILTSSICL